jgi:hypothetical protein
MSTPPPYRLLGVWPRDGAVSQTRAVYLAATELAGMCSHHVVLPCGPQVTVILRSLWDCINASTELGVEASRLMFMLEKLGAQPYVSVVAASVEVTPAYHRIAA